jgi:hypothetical protein
MVSPATAIAVKGAMRLSRRTIGFVFIFEFSAQTPGDPGENG